jgi:hypothetical protein
MIRLSWYSERQREILPARLDHVETIDRHDLLERRQAPSFRSEPIR